MVVCGNVRSLRNKMDELASLTRWNFAYRESSLICLSETWLQQDRDPDTPFEVEGFTLLRGDRTSDSGKTCGGGVCIYVNNKWCKDIHIYNKCCQSNIEYLSVSLRPYYLPREISKVFATIVYIPPEADVKVAENDLFDIISKMENDNPNAINIITGDFNNCSFHKCIPTYQQYVNFATREDRMLDPFYCNFKNCYIAKGLSPLGLSDHIMTHLIPTYRQKLKQEKPSTRQVYEWNSDVNDTVLACIECTDFDALFDESASIDQNVDVLNCYLNFCVDMLVPSRIVKCFPNNKPWVTKDLKALLNRKKKLLASKDRDQLKSVQKDINKQVAICKERYKVRVETWFKDDTKSAWKGLKQLTGMKKQNVKPDVKNVTDYCNVLNTFYARFDKYNFAEVRDSIRKFHIGRNEQQISITCDDVLKCLKCVKTNKACGPDRISAHLLKLCSEPLSPVLCKIYQQSLNSGIIPTIWKTSEIIPVPKKSNPTCYNDYRPIALTSIIMKCLERLVKNILCEQVKPYTDCYQFAYCKNRCVEDCTLSLIDYVLQHVDKSNSKDHKYFVKILYVDFSSAFNTIQPHILMQKLSVMNVNPKLILWLNNFLTSRPQYVKFLDSHSDVIITNTGAPQGCVLSPMLFTLYTSDCKCISEGCQLFKYADDTALVGLCDNSDLNYKREVELFTDWCDKNYLQLNVNKTKEMIVDFRVSPVTHDALYIKGEQVQVVSEYKYLGTIIDNRFSFDINVNAVYKKALKRVYFVRQLCKMKIDRSILNLFYMSIVQSVLTFAISCWYGNCNGESKGKIGKIVKSCKRLGVTNTQPVLELYKKVIKQRSEIIRTDCSHPLYYSYQLLPSNRRLRAAKCRTARYSRSFIPSSIRILNTQ